MAPATPAAAAAAAPPTTSAAGSTMRVDVGPRGWKPADRPGLTGPARDVVAAAPAHGAVRVLALTDAGGRPRVHVLAAPSRAAAVDAVERARALPGAVAVALDHRVRVTSMTTAAPVAAAVRALSTSDDPARPQEWGLTRLRAEQSWARQDGDGTVVAVVDSGVDAGHPDLAGVVLPGADLVTKDDGSLADPGGDGRTDANGHGTHVAGIIAAVANNGIGIAGLGQGLKILPVQVLGPDGGGYEGDVADGIIWAADHGARVLNISLGDGVDSAVVKAAIAYAQSKDVLVVAAAGNAREACTGTVADSEGCGNPVEYPAAYPGVLGVGATDTSDAIASFSETGSFVDLVAPGVRILSTWPRALTPAGRDPYVLLSGTSMAAPFVAAAAGLVRAADPTLTAAQTDVRLEQNADDLGAPGKDVEFGSGLLDPLAALAATLDAAPAPASSPRLVRLGGPDRVMTSVLAARNKWSKGAGAVVLARADQFVDALVATPLAAAKDGPIMLTGSTRLDPRVLAQLSAILPRGRTVYLVGGTGSLSDAVAASVRGAGYVVVRLGGADRYATSLAVARALGSPSTVLEASSLDYPDALSAGVAAAHLGGAVMLTAGAVPVSATTDYLAAHPGDHYAVGGSAAVADPAAEPVMGADRYGTAAAVATRFFPAPAAVTVASGAGFADALSGGPLAAALGGPLLLVRPSGALPPDVETYLSTVRAGLTTGRIMGGAAVLRGPVGSALSSAVV
ncbi:MAG: S8 family serine peptidase [Motilibacteraceae bacterium]